MMLQDGRLLDLTGNEEKGPSGEEVVGSAKEMDVKKALEVSSLSEGGVLLAIIPSKFASSLVF